MSPCSQEKRQSSVSSPLLVEMSKQTPCIAAAHSPGAGIQLGGEQAREGWGTAGQGWGLPLAKAAWHRGVLLDVPGYTDGVGQPSLGSPGLFYKTSLFALPPELCFTRAGTCFTEGSEHTDGQIKSRAREVVPAGSLLLAGRSGRRC